MIAPIEIENKEFKKVLRGYKEEEVDEFLDLVKEDYEQLYRENAELKEKVRLYQDQINKYENIEETLNATLITAQRAAEDTCNAANKKARIIVEEDEIKSIDEIFYNVDENPSGFENTMMYNLQNEAAISSLD